jgi:uncharacterized protein YdeI (YjbR/CyaY-like superfamily)
VPQVNLHSSPAKGPLRPIWQRAFRIYEALMAKSLVKTFKATLERGMEPLGWTVIRIPRDVAAAWQPRNRLPVKGEIMGPEIPGHKIGGREIGVRGIAGQGSAGFAFRTSLFPTRAGDFLLLVNKRMQAGAKVTLGSVATFRLEPDTEVREVAIPAELKEALSGQSSLRRWYDRLPYGIRKYVTDIVTGPKSPEARHRRAETIAESLLAMQEGERNPPPILEAAFVRAPLARQGWKLMTPTQRRGHLWGIFNYRSPESRQRRTAKAVEDAIRIARSKASKGKSGAPPAEEEDL